MGVEVANSDLGIRISENGFSVFFRVVAMCGEDRVLLGGTGLQEETKLFGLQKERLDRPTRERNGMDP